MALEPSHDIVNFIGRSTNLREYKQSFHKIKQIPLEICKLFFHYFPFLLYKNLFLI